MFSNLALTQHNIFPNEILSHFLANFSFEKQCLYPVTDYTAKYFRVFSKWFVANYFLGKNMAVLPHQKEAWHVYFMNIFSLMSLSTNFNSFQRVKKNQLYLVALQFKHHIIFISCGYSIKVSKSSSSLSFLWCLLYSLVNLLFNSFNVIFQTPDINAAEFKSSLQLLSKTFQIYFCT